MDWNVRKLALKLTVLVAIGAFGSACGNGTSDGNNGTGNNGGGNNGGTGPMEVSGQLTEYDHGENEVWAGDPIDEYATGTIETDGSFTVTFKDGDELDEFLLPIDPDAEGERFSAYPCQPHDNQPADISDTDARLLAVTEFTYNIMVNDNPEPWAIALTDQTEGGINIVSPLPQSTENRVMWIYADRPVQITGECTHDTGTEWPATADLDLETGWNEVNRDFENHQRHHMWTGERPDNLDWHHGEVTGGF